MERRWRLRTAGAILALLVPLQLLSALPGFHRHANELGRLLARAAKCELSAAAEAAPVTPDDCPACAVSALQAVAPLGVVAVVPAREAIGTLRPAATTVASRSTTASRGRAPPSFA